MKYSEATDYKFFTDDELLQILDNVDTLKLSIPVEFKSLSITVFSRICDGCGDAGKHSLIQRRALTQALPEYVPAFFIYDVDRFLGTDYDKARKRLIANARKCAVKRWGWKGLINPVAWVEYFKTIPDLCTALT